MSSIRELYLAADDASKRVAPVGLTDKEKEVFDAERRLFLSLAIEVQALLNELDYLYEGEEAAK
jgi:hypothetical protein